VAALSLIVDVRTDGRTFLPGLLGHLSGDDLKIDYIWDDLDIQGVAKNTPYKNLIIFRII